MSEREPKKLNFFPYYKALLATGFKNTTIRLGINKKFEKNDIVSITCGWSEEDSEPINLAKIISMSHKKIADVTDSDLQGESPDCTRKEAIPYVLSAIYRKLVSNQDYVTIIKWEKLNGVSLKWQ